MIIETDILTFIFAAFIIRRTYKELSDDEGTAKLKEAMENRIIVSLK